MSACRRPIPDEEREGWQTFGGLLAHTRVQARVSQRQLALVAGVGVRHVQNIEYGQRRTRRSTLWLMADFLAGFLDDWPPDVEDDQRADQIIYALVEVSGVTLPPESEFEQRDEVARRRRARARRAWFELTGPDERKVRQLRPAGEDLRRRARGTLREARENAGFEPWEARVRGM